MLLQETIITNWNSRTKKYYEEKGYKYTFMGDFLEVSIYDLKNNSNIKVLIKCDYCGKEYLHFWYSRTNSLSKCLIKNDCCINCIHEKNKEIFLIKYGVENPLHVPEFKEKMKQTCLEKYGKENPFQVKEFIEKSKETCLEKYGFSNFTKTNDYKEKTVSTCLEKYGETSFTKINEYREKYSKEGSAVWKGGIHDIRWDRLQKPYKLWRQKVFSRDSFLCVKCKKKKNYIEAHHIFNWNEYEDLRYEIDNGITFCKECHSNFHSIYGKKNNNFSQILEYLQIR